MKSLIFLGTLASLLLADNVSAAAIHPRGAPEHPTSRAQKVQRLSNRYIIQYKSGDKTNEFQAGLKRKSKKFKAHGNFRSAIFNGAAVEVEDVSIDALKELPGVADVWPDYRFDVVVDDAKFDFSALKTKIEKRQEIIEDNYWQALHGATGVQALHDEGIKGAGIKIAFVDSGVNYNHRVFGGCYGPGCKVVGGYDLVGDDFTWSNPAREPDDDPMDRPGADNDHGTMVASVLAGDDNIFTGVAPEASLLAYKVYGAGKVADLSVIIDAMVRAANDGADVMSLSIGYLGAWSVGPIQTAVENAVNQGIFVAFSNGNMGTFGISHVVEGAAAPHSIGTGMTGVAAIPAFNAKVTVNGNTREALFYTGGIPPPPVSQPVHFVFDTDGTTALNACTETLPATLPGNNIVVLYAPCNQPAQQAIAEDATAKGANTVLLYGTPAIDDNPYVDGKLVTKIRISDGEQIRQDIVGGNTVTFEFPQWSEYSVTAVESEIDYLGHNWYPSSSQGPNFDLALKPEILAPGGLAYVADFSGYTLKFGTSFAAPYIVGIAALYASVNGGRAGLGAEGAKALRRRIISSGQPTQARNWFNSPSFPANSYEPVWRQGAGLVNATNVLHSKILVSPATIHLNDTAHFAGQHTLSVKNSRNAPVTISASHLAGLTGYTFYPGQTSPPGFGGEPPLQSSPTAGVTFSPASLTIPAGGTGSFSVSFTEPTGLEPNRFPLYGGFVRLEASTGDHFTVPYLGAATEMKSLSIYGPAWPKFRLRSINQEILSPVYLFDGDWIDFGTLFDLGTAEYRVDVVTLDWQPTDWFWPPAPTAGGHFIGNVQTRHFVGRSWVDQFERGFQGSWDGKIGGTRVSVGQYRLRVSALKIFGNKYVESDWQTTFSPIININ